MIKRSLSIFLLLGCIGQGFSQYKFESSLDPVTKDGFHKILLTPGVTSTLRDGFPDIRIYDKGNGIVPYVIFKDEEKIGPKRFVTYETVDKKFVDGCCSHITVLNKLQDPIGHIVLEVKNADAKRQMTLSGSMDGKQWFTVKDVYSVVAFNGFEKGQNVTSNLVRFDFPVTDYLYYRFEFDRWWWWSDPQHHPVNIIRAGKIEQTFIPQECLALPDLKISRMEDQKESHINLQFPAPQFTDHISFHLSSGNIGFYRKAILYEVIRNEKDSILSESSLGAFVLSSMHENEFHLGNKKLTELKLVVFNEDNQPLTLDSLEAFQVKHYLVADLKKDAQYFFRCGNDTLPAPVYDLVYFKDKIPADAPVISSGSVKDISVTVEIAEPEIPFFKDKRFIWGALGLVALLLGFMSFRMLREMKK